MLDNVAHCLCIVRFNVKKKIVSHFTQSKDVEKLGGVVTTQSKLGKVVIAQSENTEKLRGMMNMQSENKEKLDTVITTQSEDMNCRVINKQTEEMKNLGKVMIGQSEDKGKLDRILTIQSVSTKKLGVVMLTQAKDLKEFFGLMITQSGDMKKLNEVMPVGRLSFENMCFRFTLIGSIVPCTIVLSNYSKSNNIHINLAVKHDLDDKVIILSVTCVRRDVRVVDDGSMMNRGSLIVNSADVAFTTSARSKTDDFLLFYKGFFGVQKYFTHSHIFLKDVFLPVVGWHYHAHFVAVLAGRKYPVAMSKDLNDLAMLIGRDDLVTLLRDLNEIAMLTDRVDPFDLLLGHRDLRKISPYRKVQVSTILDSSDSGMSTGHRDLASVPPAHSNHITPMFTHLHLLQIKHLRWNGSRIVLDIPSPVSVRTTPPGVQPKVADTSTFHHTFVR